MLISPVRRRIAAGAVALIAAFALLAAACGSTSGGASAGVTIEPLSPTPAASMPVGGKPAAPLANIAAAATATPAPPEVEAASKPSPSPEASSAAPAALASDGSAAPTEGRWIDVNVTTFEVRLMDGTTASSQIGPVGVGELVDTGDYASTQTGLFHVYNKVEGLAYDPPYDTYISDWVGFDPDKANGFHSFLKDKDGNVVDASTGRVSNGCIRTGAAEAVFAYAEIGMPVWVHH